MRIAIDIVVIITLVVLSVYIRKQKTKIKALKQGIHKLTIANAKLWDRVDDHVS